MVNWPKNEAEDIVQFIIVETSGMSIKSVVQLSNPTATAGSADANCLACKQAGTLEVI